MSANSAFDKKIRQAHEAMAKSIDGFARSPASEEKINQACRAALNTPDGKVLMDYLRMITVNTVMPAEVSDGQLRMQEGMRRLFGIMDARRNTTPTQK